MNHKVSSYFCNCLSCFRLPKSEENLLHDAENAQPMKNFPDLAEAPAQMPFSLMLFGAEKRGMYLKGCYNMLKLHLILSNTEFH